MKIKDLAEKLSGELVGDGKTIVSRISGAAEAQDGDLVFVLKKKFGAILETTKASCAVVPPEIKTARIPIIRCKHPGLAFKKAVEVLIPDYLQHPKGIHKTAVIGENVMLGEGVTIGAYAVLEDGVSIGERTVIYPHCYVGRSSKIGASCTIYPNVTIRENIKIGNRVIINAGTAIGNDGFGYEQTMKGHEKIPHIGDVIIEDDVELGSCVTVDRAKFSHTRIGRGTKIDNLVQVAHNVTIGAHCIIVAQCGISGSTKIGNQVMMGGQAGLVDHIEIGDGAMIAAQSGLMRSVPPNTVVWGTPARPINDMRKIHVLNDRLPEIYKRLKSVEKKLGIAKDNWKDKEQ